MGTHTQGRRRQIPHEVQAQASQHGGIAGQRLVGPGDGPPRVTVEPRTGVLRLGREIIAIERRAQAAARARGGRLQDDEASRAGTDDRADESQSVSERARQVASDERAETAESAAGRGTEQADDRAGPGTDTTPA